MYQIQLYVENQLVEMFDYESISIVDSISDIKDLSKVFIPYSRTFNVPASRQNNKIFRHFYNPEVNDVDPKKKYDAVIELNYAAFKKGKLRIEECFLKRGKPYSYKVTFFGDTIDLKDILGEDELSSLDFLDTMLTHNFTANDVSNYLEDGLDFTDTSVSPSITYDRALVYPLITHTTRLNYFDANRADNNIYSGGSGNGGVYWRELKPAIRLYMIILAIQKKYPGITFSDDFLSTTNQEFYDLYMWLNSESGDEVSVENNMVRTKLKFGSLFPDTRNIVTGEYASISGNGHELILQNGDDDNPKGGLDGFWLQIDLAGNIPASSDFTLILNRNGREYKRLTFTGSGSATTFTGSMFENAPDGTYSLFIETPVATTLTFTRMQAFVYFRTLKSTPETVEEQEVRDMATSNITSVSGNSTIFSGTEEISPTASLSGMKIIDFLSGLFKMFNLIAYAEDGIIVVKSLKDYYAGSTTTFDLTGYVNAEQHNVEVRLPYNQIDLEFEGTDTILAAHHEENFGEEWGKEEYRGDSERYFFGEPYKINIPFEHMKFERLYDLLSNDISDYIVGYAVNENLNPFKTKPLVMYVHKQDDPILVGTDKDANGAINSSTVINSYNAPSNWAALNDNDVECINFAPEINEYTLGFEDENGLVQDPSKTKTLFRQYYRDEIKDIFNPRRRIFMYEGRLPFSYLSKYTLADKVVIFDKTYRVNKIETDFTTGISTMELINIVPQVEFADFLKENYFDTIDVISLTADTTLMTADVTQSKASLGLV